MTTPWIQVYSNLPTHRKTGNFADSLGLCGGTVNPNTTAAGLLVSLWAWAIQNAYDGDLSRCSMRMIADACGWQKDPQILVQALLNSGYLDEDMKLHDWEEYAVLYLDGEDNRRAKTRERVANYRARKQTQGDVTVTSNACNNDVTVTSNDDVTVTSNACNAPTIPYHTIPNNKEKNIKKEKEPFHPPTLKDVEEYCQSRNNGIDAQHFIDYYEARGWMVGKNKMKDWKAAVRTWESRNKEKPNEHKWNIKYDNE